ncbi:MAG: triose-phosphate isomerase [Oscillospiraceae bacterium]|jgi:triosephosphate isomerase|nr:triose-phosphate isomerase [Oscillospiraceae bacterium]
MREYIIAGNWKMNVLDGENSAKFVTEFKAKKGVTAVLCPTFLHIGFLSALADRLGKPKILFGAQNVSEYTDGAYTGEVSATMIADIGAKFVIVGHSERRALFGETDEIVNRKARAVLNARLRPIICVGETLEQRERGETREVLQRQTTAAIQGLSVSELECVIFAYEPIWAIGTGRVASPEDAAAGAEAIFSASDAIAAAGSPILYGGSMTENNAAEILARQEISGGLIGGASLDPVKFGKIVEIASQLAVGK